MKTQDKATPRPWKQEGIDSPSIIGEQGEYIAYVHGHCIADASANVALIVRAVNSHDALVEALSSFLRAPSVGSDGPGTSTITIQEFNRRAARAALDAARGK